MARGQPRAVPDGPGLGLRARRGEVLRVRRPARAQQARARAWGGAVLSAKLDEVIAHGVGGKYVARHTRLDTLA
jgi:hypothetical protein